MNKCKKEIDRQLNYLLIQNKKAYIKTDKENKQRELQKKIQKQKDEERLLLIKKILNDLRLENHNMKSWKKIDINNIPDLKQYLLKNYEYR